MASLHTIMQSTPFTRPMPVMMPAPGADSAPLPSRYIACAASGAISTSDWVVDAARVQNGAAYQFVIAGSTANAIALTERLDPDGDHLVAAALLPPGSADDGRAGWVDAARYERVIGDELAWPAGITGDQKTAAIAELAALGIIVR